MIMNYLSINISMKKTIRITLAQLKMILTTTDKVHYPINIVMKDIDKEELKEVIKLLKKKG